MNELNPCVGLLHVIENTRIQTIELKSDFLYLRTYILTRLNPYVFNAMKNARMRKIQHILPYQSSYTTKTILSGLLIYTTETLTKLSTGGNKNVVITKPHALMLQRGPKVTSLVACSSRGRGAQYLRRIGGCDAHPA
jgi:hypothetical protein